MAELQSITIFHGRHFVFHLGICNLICVKLIQLMCGVITHNSVEKKDEVSINKKVHGTLLGLQNIELYQHFKKFVCGMLKTLHVFWKDFTYCRKHSQV